MQTNAMAVLATAAMIITGSTIESAGAPQARYLDGITGVPEKDSFGYVEADFDPQPRATVWLSRRASMSVRGWVLMRRTPLRVLKCNPRSLLTLGNDRSTLVTSLL